VGHKTLPESGGEMPSSLVGSSSQDVTLADLQRQERDILREVSQLDLLHDVPDIDQLLDLSDPCDSVYDPSDAAMDALFEDVSPIVSQESTPPLVSQKRKRHHTALEQNKENNATLKKSRHVSPVTKKIKKKPKHKKQRDLPPLPTLPPVDVPQQLANHDVPMVTRTIQHPPPDMAPIDPYDFRYQPGYQAHWAPGYPGPFTSPWDRWSYQSPWHTQTPPPPPVCTSVSGVPVSVAPVQTSSARAVHRLPVSSSMPQVDQCAVARETSLAASAAGLMTSNVLSVSSLPSWTTPVSGTKDPPDVFRVADIPFPPGPSLSAVETDIKTNMNDVASDVVNLDDDAHTTYTARSEHTEAFAYSERVAVVRQLLGSHLPTPRSPKKSKRPSALGLFGAKDPPQCTTFTLPAAKWYAGVLDDCISEISATKGSKQSDRRWAPMSVGKYPALPRPRGMFYELAEDAWSWREPEIDPQLPKLLNTDAKDKDLVLRPNVFREWQCAAHQTGSDQSRVHLQAMADSLMDFEDPDGPLTQEDGQEIDVLVPSTVLAAVTPIVDNLFEMQQLMVSMATTLHQTAAMQLQLLAQLQLFRRDGFLRMLPKTVTSDAAALLRQAPLGGPLLFGAPLLAVLALKEKEEHSAVNRQFLSQNKSAPQNSRKGGGGNNSSGRGGGTNTNTNRDRDNAPSSSQGRGRGSVPEGNPFPARRGGGRGNRRGGGRGRGGDGRQQHQQQQQGGRGKRK
jgi:hypothetical protein